MMLGIVHGTIPSKPENPLQKLCETSAFLKTFWFALRAGFS
jgi:hypothetical protein